MTVRNAVIALPKIGDLAEMDGIWQEVPGVGEAIIARAGVARLHLAPLVLRWITCLVRFESGGVAEEIGRAAG